MYSFTFVHKNTLNHIDYEEYIKCTGAKWIYGKYYWFQWSVSSRFL